MVHASAASFGGRFVSEALWSPLAELEEHWGHIKRQDTFWQAFEALLDERGARPTALSPLPRLQRERGGAKLWIKREDMAPGGSYCLVPAALQALLGQRLGKRRLITESATGAFGVALAELAAPLGLEVTVHMTREDASREKRRVSLMRQLGARVELTESAMSGRFVAQAWSMRDWVAHRHEALYCASTLASPDPYPRLIARACAMIGAELLAQLRRVGLAPTHVVCPVGAGGLAAGVMGPLMDSLEATLIGVQGCGDDPEDAQTPLCGGRPGYLHGVYSMMLRSDEGLVMSSHTRARGLAESIVGPHHARWAAQGKVSYASRSDREALDALRALAKLEGIVLAPESGAALSHAMQLLPDLPESADVVLVASGSGLTELEWLRSGAGAP